jgi:hypothetical protein
MAYVGFRLGFLHYLAVLCGKIESFFVHRPDEIGSALAWVSQDKLSTPVVPMFIVSWRL